MNVRQLVTQDMQGLGHPCGIVTDHETHGEGGFGGGGNLARRPHGGLGLRQHEAGMIQEDSAGGGQTHSPRASREKRCPDFLFQVANLAAQGGLSRVQLFLSGQLEASGFSHRYEISKMSELHVALCLKGIPFLPTKQFYSRISAPTIPPANSRMIELIT